MNALEKINNKEIKVDALADLPIAVEQAGRATAGGTENRGHLIVGVDNVKLR